ncbi:MAG: Cof-type HAD-IIB family hydrolase [Anaerostipes faecalis]|nr:Cof-type HAD-IIB family hydrolase [Anaerostipes faecalis]MDY2725372.1 Cof-type HAD-IIB family hydrolase [Anaerostipes faecalis]
MIRLIATDIDGTLVKDGTLDLNPEYFDVIRQLRSRGVLFLAASGRQRESITKVFTPVKDDIAFISENGTCIHSKDYQYVDVIQPEVVRAYIDEARRFPGCEVSINKDNMGYFENYGVYNHLVNDYGYRGKMVDDIGEYAEDVCKISMFHHRDIEKVVGQDFLERWNRIMHVTFSGKFWIDCSNKGVTKGSALKHFQDDYHITPDETLAFGDNLNDIEMLQRASHSFAVANARDEVKAAANFIAPSYKEDGVLQVLKAVLRGELC